MDNITIELYIIGYTLIGIVIIWLYTLPLKIVGGAFLGIKKIFNNNKGGGIF